MPQKRERVIIVGFRNDLGIKFEFPAIVCSSESDYSILGSVIENKVDKKYFFSENAVSEMMKNRENMNKNQTKNLNAPCNTVGAHLAKVSLNSTDPVLYQNGKYRRVTPREVARIQSFPDTFELMGTEFAQYRTFGNAIPPILLNAPVKTFQKWQSKPPLKPLHIV